MLNWDLTRGAAARGENPLLSPGFDAGFGVCWILWLAGALSSTPQRVFVCSLSAALWFLMSPQPGSYVHEVGLGTEEWHSSSVYSLNNPESGWAQSCGELQPGQEEFLGMERSLKCPGREQPTPSTPKGQGLGCLSPHQRLKKDS